MYNFSEFEKIFTNMKSQGANSSNLSALKNELNRFFKDSKCMEVIYTDNKDKMFFGMCVLPVLENRYFLNVQNDADIRFDKYYLEIDSKLLSPLLGVTTRELTAVCLHEVGHIVNDSVPSRTVSAALNYEIAKSGVKMSVEEQIQNAEFFEIGILRGLRMTFSLFERKDEEFLADDFVVKCGYGADLESLFKKIIKSRDAINPKKPLTFTTLIWNIKVANDLKNRRANAIQQLQTSEKIEGSKLFRDAYAKGVNALKRAYGNLTESAYQRYAYEADQYVTENLFKDIKYSTLKGIEGDMYEINVRIKNIEDESDAMFVLRSINLRLNLIEEYLSREKVGESEADRLRDISNKLRSLREELVRNATSHKKFYGLFIEYPEINKGSRL